MLRFALLFCALAVWGNEVEGGSQKGLKKKRDIDYGFKTIDLSDKDLNTLKVLAAPKKLEMTEMEFGLKVVTLRSFGKEGSKEYIPKGAKYYVAYVDTPKGQCYMKAVELQDGVVVPNSLVVDCDRAKTDPDAIENPDYYLTELVISEISKIEKSLIHWKH